MAAHKPPITPRTRSHPKCDWQALRASRYLGHELRNNTFTRLLRFPTAFYAADAAQTIRVESASDRPLQYKDHYSSPTTPINITAVNPSAHLNEA